MSTQVYSTAAFSDSRFKLNLSDSFSFCERLNISDWLIGKNLIRSKKGMKH